VETDVFYRDKILNALNAKLAALTELDAEQRMRLQELYAARDGLTGKNAAELCKLLAMQKAPGALPTDEFDAQPNLRVTFPERWANLAEMRHWAAETLANVTTCAVDGSQLPATKDFPLPVAAIQVAWFTNPHAPNGAYEKDVHVEVLTPRDLGDGDSDANMWIGLRRYELEVARINTFMREQSARGKRAVALFDGSLTVSFAGGYPDDVRGRYRDAAVSMLRTSEQSEVPLIAYIDRSRARDFTRMLCYIHGISIENASLVSDAVLLDEQNESVQPWRLVAFLCQRQDVAQEENYTDSETGKSYSNEICFTYLKINRSPPARLEFPAWVLRAGMLDSVIDWVRAEAISGNGYPYAIQAADAAAVIDFRDRQRYQRALEEFGGRNNIRTMQPSAKQASKERRRA
jgi:hypothetical protein